MKNLNPLSGVTGKGDENMTTKTIARSDSPFLPIAFAVFGGMMLLFASGYAQASILHDAAHDQRHAMAFPCH